MDVRPVEPSPLAGVAEMESSPHSGHLEAQRSLAEIDAQLAGLAHLSNAEHVDVFTVIHQRLVAALAVTGGQTDAAPDHQHAAGRHGAGQHATGQDAASQHGADQRDSGRQRSR